jgi:hypothetical protein
VLGVHFQAALAHAVSSKEPKPGHAAANEAAAEVTSIIERELRKQSVLSPVPVFRA